jgi:hypothetical protein
MQPAFSNNLERNVKVFLLFLGVLQFFIHSCFIFRNVDFIAARLTIDDTYYYLQTAWNYRFLGFSTFDGIHPTNGLQFLWFGVLSLLSFAASSKTVFLKMALMLCNLFNISGYFFIWKIGKINRAFVFAAVAATAWFYLCVKFHFRNLVYLNGMETSLHALIYWFLIWRLGVFVSEDQSSKVKNFWLVIAAIVGLAYARVDAAIYSASIFIFLLLKMRHRPAVFLPSVLVSLCFAGLLLGLYMKLGGFWLPVAGLIKQDNHMLSISSLFETASRMLVWTYPFNIHHYLFLKVNEGQKLMLQMSGLLVFAGCFLLSVLKCSDKKLRIFLNTCALLWLPTLFHLIFISGVIPSRNFRYQTPHFILALLSIALIIQVWVNHLNSQPKAFAVYCKNFLVFVAVFMVLRSGLSAHARLRLYEYRHNVHYARIQVAGWIDKNLPPPSILAAWNAGELGYFCNRRVINLDGLINSYDYYKTVLRGSVDLKDYLKKNNVDYLVDVTGKIQEENVDYPHVKTFFPEFGDNALEIRRVNSQNGSLESVSP